jgi:prepilin peptidase CpaA
MDPGRTALCVCFAIVCVAAISDTVTRKIPNTLTLGGIVLGLAIHTAVARVEGGTAVGGLGRGLMGVAVCGILPVICFARGEMGGGDVKLFAAIGALCGPILGFEVQASTYLIVIALVLPFRLLRHRALGTSLRNGWTALRNAFRDRDRRLAYGVVKLPPVILAPSILLGMCLALARHGVLP